MTYNISFYVIIGQYHYSTCESDGPYLQSELLDIATDMETAGEMVKDITSKEFYDHYESFVVQRVEI